MAADSKIVHLTPQGVAFTSGQTRLTRNDQKPVNHCPIRELKHCGPKKLGITRIGNPAKA